MWHVKSNCPVWHQFWLEYCKMTDISGRNASTHSSPLPLQERSSIQCNVKTCKMCIVQLVKIYLFGNLHLLKLQLQLSFSKMRGELVPVGGGELLPVRGEVSRI